MQTLPKPKTHDSEAGSVSDILAKANPAEMPAMRASLSFLTSAGAELATALARRNQQYDELLSIVSVLPPEWVEAAKTGSPLPEFGPLRAELALAKDESIDLRGQIAERDQQLKGLHDQISQLQTELLVLPETRARQVEELQAESDTIALARAKAEDDLKASEAELNDIEARLASLRDEIMAALPEQEPAAAASAEEPSADPRQRRAMRLGALAAAATALIDHDRQNAEQVEAANAQIASMREEFEVVSAHRMGLEADLQEKLQTLEDQQTQLEHLQSQAETLNAQIEQLTEQTTQLQAELDGELAAKAQVEEQLQASLGELAELNQQIDSVGQQLRAVLPEDVMAELTPAEPELQVEDLVAEGGDGVPDGDVPTRSAAPQMLGLGAVAAGVAAAVDLSNQKTGEADLASQQLAAALATNADLEQQLGERDSLLSALQGQIDDAVIRLQEIVPVEDLPQAETPEAAAEPAEGEPTEDEAAEGEAVEAEAEGDGRAAGAVGLTALVTGVAAVVGRNKSSLAELETKIDELSQAKASLEASLEGKDGELTGYNDYALNLQGQVNELSSQVTSLEAALAVKEQAEAETQAQIDALNGQIETLETQIADLQAQLDASNAAQAELEQALQATQEQLAAAQAELAQINEESQRVLGEGAARLGVVGAGAAAVAAIRNKEEELDAANQQMAALQAQLDENNAAKVALDEQVSQNNADVEALNAQIAALQADRDGIALEKDELAATLQSREDELTDLQGQLEALQAQVAAVAEERSALETHVAQIEEALGGIESQRSAGLNLAAAAELSEALANLPAIKTQAASAAIVAGVKPVLSPRIQALNDVAGIGSAYQQRLYGAGVGTYWELSSLTDAGLETVLQIPELQRARIDFEETRADAYQWAQKTDTIGLLWDGDHVDDFEALPGVGKTFEKRLYEAGITTYEQLLDCEVERLAEIIKPPPMREVNYEDWKERARQMLAERQAAQAAE